ncbi:MAG: ABC transporter substrate-binding protein [Anaerolineae bacterium]|nr:ABC transporter substrate-binding protein [Anaerolineae bacterium]
MPANKPSKRSFTLLSLGCLLAAMLFLAGCINAPPRTLKIGLVAPFEGRYREIGEEVIPAARLAVRQFAGLDTYADVRIELVAYDDAGDPQQAIEQARRLAVDPEVVAVVGHWRSTTTQAAASIYAQAGLPLLTVSTRDIDTSGQVYNLAPPYAHMEQATQEWLQAQELTGTLRLEIPEDIVIAAGEFRADEPPGSDILIGGPEWGLRQFYALTGPSADGIYFATSVGKPGDVRCDYWTDERTLQFVEGFEEGSPGAPPGIFSISAYESTWLAINLAIGEPIDASPLNINQFDQSGRRAGAPIYLYRWEEGQREFVTQLR